MRRKDPTEGLPLSALERMRSYYTDRVPYHDTYMSWTGREEMEELLAPIIATVIEEVHNRDVLEVACGTGNWTQIISSHARSVVATDLIGANLDVARGKGFPRENVTLLEADAYSLDGIGGPFDVAVVADFWSHIPHSMMDTFMRSLASVLRPSARVVVIDMLKTPSFDLAFRHFDAEENEIQLRTLPNGESYLVVKNFPEIEELMGWLEGWTEDVDYREVEDLDRWILCFTMVP